MKKNMLVFLMVGLFITLHITYVYAQSYDLNYQAVFGALTYKSEIFFENIVNTGTTHVSTRMVISSFLENEISEQDNNLFVKLTFKNINLNEYQRELKILDKKTHKTDRGDRSDIESTLKKNILYKWINILINPKGLILEKYYSSDLSNVSYFDLSQVIEQFFITLPDKEIEVGEGWYDTDSSIFPSYNNEKPFIGVVHYIYLGQEEYNGILCHKIKSHIFLDEEQQLGEGMTEFSWAGLGTLYFAVEGNYLVRSEVISNFSLMVLVEGEEENPLRNFTQTGVKYTIDLVFTDR